MSNFKPGDWCDTWDGLFWSFITDHRDFFEANSRIAPIVRQIDRMSKAKLDQHRAFASDFLQRQ